MSDSKIIIKIKNIFSKFKKLDNEDLRKVNGAGTEPQEFDWKTKGYVTPEKDQNKNGEWNFEAIGNKDKKDIFKK